MELTIVDLMNELKQIRVDIKIIKDKLDEEELTPWAEKELDDARSRSEKISHEDIKNLISSR